MIKRKWFSPLPGIPLFFLISSHFDKEQNCRPGAPARNLEASLASGSLSLTSHPVSNSSCQLRPKSISFSPSVLVSPLLGVPHFSSCSFHEAARGMFCKSTQQTCHSSVKNPAVASHFSQTQSKLLIRALEALDGQPGLPPTKPAHGTVSPAPLAFCSWDTGSSPTQAFTQASSQPGLLCPSTVRGLAWFQPNSNHPLV